MALEKTVYTANAVADGGRDGHSKTDDGSFSVKLAVPKAMGGSGDGQNPEQLFAAGYAACFLGAMKFVASKHPSMPKPGEDTKVHSSVSIGPRTDGKGFGLEVELKVEMPGVASDQVKALMDEAHIVCPYSNATQNNIPVKLSVA